MSPRKRQETPIPADVPEELQPPSRAASQVPRKEAVDERPRFMSAEEKHQLIMEYASQRKPVDNRQRLSLWAGVIICGLAIGLGWLYAARQSVANAIQAPSEQTVAEIGVTDPQDQSGKSTAGQEFQNNIKNAMNSLSDLQARSAAEVRAAAAMREQVQQTAASGSSPTATTTVSLPSVKPATGETPKKNAGYKLPSGVETDKE